MKNKIKLRVSKMRLATSLIFLSGICGFAPVAISSPDGPTPSTVESSSTAQSDEISDGSTLDLGGGLSITPIKGWKIERKSLGMTLLMREVPDSPQGEIDYSKPTFNRNISVMTLPEATPIDSNSIEELKIKISKMIARDPSLTNFSFTEAKFFDYKNKNDGVVLFSQLTANNFPMMQMQIVVSGEKKSYLLTYSDLASNFANPSTFESAWKTMTSVTVQGTAPKRYEKEILVAGSVSGVAMILILPFFLARWRSSRKIRKLADELQYDWDHGAIKTDSDYQLSDIKELPSTVIPLPKVGRKAIGSEFESDFSPGRNKPLRNSSLLSSVESFSTRHSRFV